MTKGRKIGKVLWIALIMEVVICGGILFYTAHESRETTKTMAEDIINEISERDDCIALMTQQGNGYVVKQVPILFGDTTYYYVEDAELKFVGTLEEWNAWN